MIKCVGRLRNGGVEIAYICKKCGDTIITFTKIGENKNLQEMCTKCQMELNNAN